MAQARADVEAEFLAALRRAGLRLKGTPIMDGRKHRVAVEGDRPGRLSGTYIGHFDEHPAGYIHNFKTGEEVRWKAVRALSVLSPLERNRLKSRVATEQAAREAARRRREAAVSRRAMAVWNRARPVETHPYLVRKDITAGELRRDRAGHLLVPMRDADGRLWGVQTIDAEGTKRFMSGGRKQGLYATLGTPEAGEPVLIAEGYATAASLRRVTGLATIAAFDSGNLLDVARAVRQREPARRIVIAADNDHHLPRQAVPLPNVGLEKAHAAAAAVGGVGLSPPFAPGDTGTDWNDHAAQNGREATRAVVQAVLRVHGIALPHPSQASQTPIREATAPRPSVARVPATQVERDAARQRLPSGARAEPGTAAQTAARAAAPQSQRERPPGARL